VSNARISRFNGGSDPIEVDFVEREATPAEIMELTIHLHLGGLSLSYAVSILDGFGVTRARSTVHNWVQTADLDSRGGRDSDIIALDETVINVTGDGFWLIAAVAPDTNVFLHVRRYPARSTALTKKILRELHKNTPLTTPNSSSMAPLVACRLVRTRHVLPPRNIRRPEHGRTYLSMRKTMNNPILQYILTCESRIG